jgi:hypothetical protein
VVAFGGLHHAERRAPPENVGHQAAVPRVEVLHDDDRSGKIRRQITQDLAQSRNATSRRGQGDHVEGRTRKGLGLFPRLDLIRLG